MRHIALNRNPQYHKGLAGVPGVRAFMIALSVLSIFAFSEAQARVMSLQCRFKDNKNRDVIAIFEIDSSEVNSMKAQGSLILKVNGFEFPGIPAYRTTERGSTIQVQNSNIKFVNLSFDLGSKHLAMGTSDSDISSASIDFTDELTGGRVVPASCTR